MSRRFVVCLLTTVLALCATLVFADTSQINLLPGDMRPVTCETGASYANHTLTCPTPTATAGNQTPEDGVGQWTPPSSSEHGDAPPAWATAWSQAQFGHGIVYGGDEATPHEWMMKPTAFKGYSFTKDGVSVYVRVHEASNAMDRQKQFHSYEVYARDATGAVSFWQGWLDRGDPATARFATCSTSFDKTLPATGTPHGWVADGCGHEAWYTRGPDWGWDIVDVINDATTTPKPGETANDMDPASWTTTGKLGLSRTIYAYYYADGATRYPTRNSPTLRGWFCATAQGQITGSVNGPGDCAAGTLPQYVAPTMPSVETASGYTRVYPGAATVQLPN